MKNVIFIGFMGSGKSTIGNLLAKKLNRKFVEMDEQVLKRSDEKSIPWIFETKGETYFRELEMKLAIELGKKEDLIIATGGGAVMNKNTIDYLHENGRIVYLDVSFDTIKKRISGDTNRPNFKDITKAHHLYLFRKSMYKEYSDFQVKTEDKTPEMIVEEILKLLN